MSTPTTVDPPAEPAESKPPRSGRSWKIIATSLVVLTAILAPLAVDAVWIRDQVLDTDAFVEEMSPLIRDPNVQQQIIAKVNDDLLADVDIQSFLEKEIPDGLGFLAGPAEEAIRAFVLRVTTRIVESEQFATLFDKALRLTHATLMKVLTGGGPIVQVEDGVVTLDLTDLRTQVVAKINDSGLGNFINPDPNKTVRIELMQSTNLATAQRFVRLLDQLGIWLPVIVAVLGAAAILFSRDRRRGVMWVGVGVAIAMVVHLAALAVGRSLYVDVVTKTLSKNASGLAYDLLIHFPRQGTRVVLLIALLMVLGALVAGPASWAVSLRGLVARAAGRGGAAAGSAVGPLASVGRVIAPHEAGIRALILVVAALSLVIGAHPSIATVLWTAVIALLAIILLRVIAAAGPATDPAEDETPIDQEPEPVA